MSGIPHADKPGFGRRNRNDDSSSSRESSPARKQKRSFTPTSDDEVVISIADDDTPPPEGPIIRQAVAFSWTPSIPTAPASINTYQASPIPTQKHNTFFLPGQEVAAPPPPPPKPSKGRKPSAPRFPTQTSQTSRFRIDAYDPTPTAAPALTAGDGPYASMYRANASSAVDDAGSAAGNEPAPVEAPANGRRKRAKPSESRPRASTSKAKATTSKTKSVTSKKKISNSDQRPSATPSIMASSAILDPQEGSTGSPYYRRDYVESNAHELTANSGSEHSPSPRQELRLLHANKRSQIPLRLVTILIEDIRGDVPDSQLVEVRVALRDSEDTIRDGYWANAEDICKTLQTSPSRIDGPAKVYALRGKYRQMVLKVTADNRDEWVTANVVVNPDRTLDMIVQTGLPSGPALGSLGGGRHILPSEPGAPVQFPPGTGFTNPEQGSRKRRHSPLDDYRDKSIHSRQWSPSTLASSPRGSPSRGPSTSYRSPPSIGAPDARSLLPNHQPQSHDYSPASFEDQARSESESSESEDESEKHARISKEVDELIQKEPTWIDYFKVSAKPRSASAVLKEYGIVQGFVDKWMGKPVPSGPLIEKSHIAQALQIEELERARYMSDCAETLHLMALYGPEGRRLRDPEVVEKANDGSDPPYNAKPIKRLLKLLRKIDERWVAGHS
ncbi:hypothetical protein B0H15DRAFT_600653 [Mycena belliarum]|uniref:Uncharacterized protein n=1 Tax=Mycena belliarum TaxID=1033014 RepID=A0AAD6TQW1_9AGAR|nr:hypothetical protein B0H15DRAFT_600653 [Mycena belliae]